MDLVGLFQLVWKYRLITLPLLVVTVAVAVYAEDVGPSQFEASGAVLVSDSRPSDAVDVVSLTEPADIARALRLSQTAELALAASSVSDLSIGTTEDRGVRIVVSGTPASEVEGHALELADAALEIVIDRQEDSGIPESERIRGVRRGSSTEPGNGEEFITLVEVSLDDQPAAVNNPLGPTIATGRLLQIASLSDAGQETIAEQTGPDLEFEVQLDPRDQAPILEIRVLDRSPESALNGFDVVVNFLSQHLSERQEAAGVRSSDRLILEVLAAPQRARDVSPPVSRAAAVILSIGVFLTLVTAAFADNVQRRQLARRDWGERAPETRVRIGGNEADAPSPGHSRADSAASGPRK